MEDELWQKIPATRNGYGAKEYVAFKLAEQIYAMERSLYDEKQDGNTTSICLREYLRRRRANGAIDEVHLTPPLLVSGFTHRHRPAAGFTVLSGVSPTPQNRAWKIAINEKSYTRDCVEAEHLVRFTIMRIIDEMPDAGELAQRTEFLATARKDPELSECMCICRVPFRVGLHLLPPRMAQSVRNFERSWSNSRWQFDIRPRPRNVTTDCLDNYVEPYDRSQALPPARPKAW